MTRLPAFHFADADAVADDDAEDQLSLLGKTARDFLGVRPPGERPLGPAARFCDATVVHEGRAVVCYGSVMYTVDRYGQLVTVCQRASCGRVALVPRRYGTAEPARPCPRCTRLIEGDNAGKPERGPTYCVACRLEKNASNRAREKNRKRMKQGDRRREQRDRVARMRTLREVDGMTLDAIGVRFGLTGERVRQLLAEQATTTDTNNNTTTSEDAAA